MIKLLTTITLSLVTTTSLFAQKTMCFKENHQKITTIETTALDGGLCSSQKSLADMKRDGWIVEDIKVEKTDLGSNYIYILKKQTTSLSSVNEEELEQKILQRLQKKQKKEKVAKKAEIKIKMSEDGKTFYTKKCQTCHGKKADEIYGQARALSKLSFFDFKTALRDYGLGEYDRGQAFIMTPYATLMNSEDIKNVYSYIQSLKSQEEQED